MRLSEIIAAIILFGGLAYFLNRVFGEYNVLFWMCAGIFGVIQFFKYVVNPN